jgi:peptidoglycan-associated lipoprotein
MVYFAILWCFLKFWADLPNSLISRPIHQPQKRRHHCSLKRGIISIHGVERRKKTNETGNHLYQEDLMSVSQNNNRLFLAIFLGIFMASGCSGHAVKYGANSEGEGMGSEEAMHGAESGVPTHGRTLNADGTTLNGGMVDGNNPSMQSSQGMSKNNGEMKSEMTAIDGTPIVPGSGSDYGRQFDGVDGSGPNHGGVTGFGNGSANASNPEPETWANAFLRERRGGQAVSADPSEVGASNKGESASSMESNPGKWAQAYSQEHGGPSPEYVNPDMSIAPADEPKDLHSIALREPSVDSLMIGSAKVGYEGRVQDIYFAFDSWSISSEGARYLEEDAKWLQANPEKVLTIEGHCDQRGTQDYNLVLGKKRAEAAREFLINLGVQPNRINIVSYGKERPFCQNNNEECFQENRRNHMVVRMNQS